jgi:hypothetical protein
VDMLWRRQRFIAELDGHRFHPSPYVGSIVIPSQDHGGICPQIRRDSDVVRTLHR